MKNNSFRLFVHRRSGDGQICGFRLLCATVLVLSFSVLGLAQNPAANITGSGTADFIPRWTGTTTLGNSNIFETIGGNVGIATVTPAAKLDVKGTAAVRDTLILIPKLTHPTLSVNGTAFAVSSTGLVTFVSGQAFPGAGTVTSVGSGLGLTGGPITTSGTLAIDPSVVPQLAANNNFTGSEGIAGNLSVGLGLSVGDSGNFRGSGSFGGPVTVTVGNSAGIAAYNNSTTYTLSLQNHAAASNTTFMEAQFDLNGKAVFYTDTLGDTTAIGTKHAAVPLHGQMVDVSSMESPEVWFEDFGAGQLMGGIATVSVDASFSQIVSLSAGYHVFVTPKGDCKGLFVANQTASGFEVRELSGGQSSVEFDYRIVAHRKGYEKVRLPIAKMPKLQATYVK